MEIIKNKIFPFGNYKAINLFGFIFTKSVLSQQDTNHEAIHTAQMEELLYVFFYLFYFIEWIYELIKVIIMHDYARLKDIPHQAYRCVSFEREAYLHEQNLEYLKTREKFSQWL